MDKNQVSKVYGLSPLQQGMLFHYLEDQTETVHLQQARMMLAGELDRVRLEASLQQLVERHDVLRTIFVYEGVSQPLQVVLHERNIPIDYHDLTLLSKDEQSAELARLQQREQRSFDLSRDRLVRITLCKLAASKHQLLLTFHHILLDGWSIGQLVEDLLTLYAEGAQGLPEAAAYDRYIQWLQHQPTTTAATYWQEALAGYDTVVQLPQTSTPSQEAKEETALYRLDESMTASLLRLGQQAQVTLNTVFQTLWGLLLQKYTQADDVVFGTVVSGRSARVTAVERMVGLLINTLPVRVQTRPDESLHALLQRQQQLLFEMESHHYLSLAEIQAGRVDSAPLFDQLLVFENAPFVMQEKAGIAVQEIEVLGKTNYALNLFVVPDEQTIRLQFLYNQQRYERGTIDRLFAHLQHLITQVTNGPTLPLQEISLLTSTEAAAFRNAWQRQEADYPRKQTLHQLFTDQANRTPEAVAVVLDEQQLRYRELEQRSNQLARLLRAKGVGRESVVALQVEKSFDMVVGILAILKAGGAYLPIEPDYPMERVAFMLTDSQALLLLTHQQMKPPSTFTGEVLHIDEQSLYQGDKTSLDVINEASDLAYVLYTSGSTGQPKGVMVEHRQVTRLWHYEGNKWHIQLTDNWAMFHSYCFDVSVGELFGALLHGATLVLVSNWAAKDVGQLRRLLLEQQVTILCQTPSAFGSLLAVERAQERHNLPLRRIIYGGEALSFASLAEWRRFYPQTELLNMYGPTEAAIYTTVKLIGDADIADNRSNIGRPLPTTRAYVLDARQQLVPPGVVGELYLSGAGVTRGYLNRADLTAERFVEDPFVPGARMYRTGDYARWIKQGELEYLGRIDDQVKVRGYRIELGEVTTRLLSHPQITEGVVLVQQGEICAYVVGQVPHNLHDYLVAHLPVYMVPSYYIPIERIPLTTNGKLDRQALPTPSAKQQQAAYQAPSNQTEAKLVRLWGELLGIERVGVFDDFFRLGGHSLKAMQLLTQIKQQWQVDLPLKTLFQQPTIRQLGLAIRQAEQQIDSSIEVAPQQESYPVTSMQKRLYVLQGFEHVQTGYNIPFVQWLTGLLNVERLQHALRQLVARHEILRTSFHLADGELVQRVHPTVSVNLEIHEVSDMDRLDEQIARSIRPFALDQAPLMRAVLWRLEEERHVLLLDLHHIIADGISLQILWHELVLLYQGQRLPAPSLHYKDVAYWQQRQRDREWMSRQENYWLAQLSGELPLLELPTDAPRPSVQQFAGALYRTTLSHELSQSVRQLAEQEQSTLYPVLLSAYAVLLMKLSGQSDLIIGSPFAARTRSEWEHMIGMFVNTLPIRIQPQPDQHFRQLVKQVKEQLLSAYEYGEYPLEQLIDCLDLQRDVSRNPLFDTIFLLQNKEPVIQSAEEWDRESYPLSTTTAKFDLSLTVVEGEQLALGIEYSTHLFSAETIAKMAEYYERLLLQMVESADQPLDELTLLTAADQEQLLSMAGTHVDYPQNKTLHGLFSQQAVQTPDAIAVVSEDRRCSYRELDQRSNQLARVLQAKGVSRESIVALQVEKSIEMVVGILAILKAGGAYLPIEPTYPVDRVEYMLADSKAALLLTQTGLFPPATFQGTTLYLDDATLYSQPATSLAAADEASDLAYLLYTSGSTGQPKGVMVEHRHVTRLWFHEGSEWQINPNDRWAMFHSYCFDVSVCEIFGALLHGATLVLVPTWTAKDPYQLRALLQREQVTILCQTPSAFAPLTIAERTASEHNLSLTRIILAGEALTPSQLQEWHSYYPQTRLFNMYGPTEAAIYATVKEIDEWAMNEQRSNIGCPLPTMKAYVLDEHCRLLPLGVVGELYLGGAGVTRGYLNRPELTMERFIPDPFVAGARVYRTGDQVRWLANGELEYLGRIDDQVKIRGYRIELGEITSHLLTHPEVTDGIVLAHNEQGEASLCAYVVDHVPTGLRDYLAKRLPDHMLPRYFVPLDRLPLTTNGKLDRRSLPKPTSEQQSPTTYLAPRTAEEELLADVWQEVLGLAKIGVTENFFTMGGDSIRAMQVAARLRMLEREIEMKDLFQNPTIAGLAPLVRHLSAVKEQGIVSGHVELLPIQQWFFAQQFRDEHHWNQAVMLYRQEGWSASLLHQVWTGLTEHHDALRMVYRRQAGEIQQFNQDHTGKHFTLTVFDLHREHHVTARMEQVAASLQTKHRLEQGPLLQLALFKTAIGDYLMLSVHHLVIDGVSWRILLEDFVTGYGQLERAEPLRFPLKSSSYQEWAQQLTTSVSQGVWQEELAYWQRMVDCQTPSLPRDSLSESLISTHQRGAITTHLDERTTTQFFKEAQHAYRTESNDLLLSALALTIHEWTGERRVLVNLEGHGREEVLSGVDVTRTVGWFTSLYPVLLEVTPLDLGATIKAIKEQLHNVPHKGMGYGILRYLAKESSLAMNPDICFNYLGQFREQLPHDTAKLSAMPIGDVIGPRNHPVYPLEWNSVVVEGRFRLDITYNKQWYQHERVEQLAERYLYHLRQLIQHCLKKDHVEWTPSDFAAKRLSFDDLETVLSELDQH